MTKDIPKGVTSVYRDAAPLCFVKTFQQGARQGSVLRATHGSTWEGEKTLIESARRPACVSRPQTTSIEPGLLSNGTSRMNNGTTTYMRSTIIGVSSIPQRGSNSAPVLAATAPVPRSPSLSAGVSLSKSLKIKLGGAPGAQGTGLGSSNTSSNRRVVNHLYMAPLALIRNPNDPPSKSYGTVIGNANSGSSHSVKKCAGYTENGIDPSSSTRRRRGSHRGGADGFAALERQGSNRSITDEFLMNDRRSDAGEFVGAKKALPRPPRLWGSDDKNDSDDDLGGNGGDEESSLIAALHNSSPELLQSHRHNSTDFSPLRPRRRWMQGNSPHDSDHPLDQSNQGVKPPSGCFYRSNAGCQDVSDDNVGGKVKAAPAKVLAMRSFVSATNMIQLLVLLVLAIFVYDSHHKVKSHKVRLREYDEERSHMLEQMMWIDQAAKKVHTRYSSLLQNDPSLETREELLDEARYLRDELERMQVRIQLNSRDRIHQLFGNKPLHITFKFASSAPSVSVDNVVAVALSDDTPHAVATLLSQVDSRLWDQVEYEAVEPGVVQISSALATSSPLLEFAERSRGCHGVGSVAMRSVVKHELTRIVLRVHLIEKAPMSDKDVCIGKVLSGLELLNQIAHPERR
jgi:hypothetical protein